MQIRFDQGPLGAGTWFDGAERLIVADTPDQVAEAFAAMDQARADGKWLAGYATYELGYALEPRLLPRMPEGRALPLICFGVYDAPGLKALAHGSAALTNPKPLWDEPRYQQAFDQVNGYIGAGDIYQANLTFPMTAEYKGTSEALYAALSTRQPVGQGAMVLQDGLPDLLSRSPELFFRTTSAGVIETRPMKGTQPRSEDPEEDAKRVAFLQADEKNRAENLMIVDLLRNDISRVAELGSVHVPELFKVESYATVHQMVSLVRATLRQGVSLGDIFTALFPCGSITGAPKLRAMEILNDLEPDARDIYCGTIGWAAPDGRSDFNVAIRTLMVKDGKARLNVGGGVVWDSTGPSEYEEALWKARYAAAFQLERD
ncbi:aminodeoxychorismate synthase component I [Cognatishimia activa]|uniref:Para-aminobenzoate synthase component 1 n=1 Tax=Cognatishimia activa TaxID=1715691 RepID=A0A0P1ISB3_9RHOB|nr:aminodeoxychorismate synthase component I [Cognatishimia activa]CUI66569.1 Para-aminobenzoate synthase component 1 [Cognatishimia activa]CUK26452.1 Para-aminobenzoate synthase component 1 [Cognatishimia activa]